MKSPKEWVIKLFLKTMQSHFARFPFRKDVLTALICLLLTSNRSYGSVADSTLPTIPTRISSYSEEQWMNGGPGNPLDTGFSELNMPDPVVRDGNQHLGVVGSPSRALWSPYKTSIYNWTGLTSSDPWLLRTEGIRYFRTNKRLTRLDYHMGSFREQSIEAFHTQNILRNWNAGLRFRRFNVKDFLPRSDPYYNRFLFFTDFESNNGRYHIFANALWNSLRNQLNGGITNDTVFTDQEVSNLDLKGLPINLSQAENRTREKSFEISQFFRLDRPSDSARFSTRLFFDSRYTAGSSSYSDKLQDSSSFYKYYYDGLTSYDSLGYQDFRNKGGIGISFRSGRTAFSLSPFMEHQSYRYSQDTLIEQNNLAAGGNFGVSSGSISLNISQKSIFSGPLEGNFVAQATINYTKGNWTAAAAYSMSRASVPLVFSYFKTNHLRWSNQFNPIDNSLISLSITQHQAQFSLELQSETIDGFIYMGRDAAPMQAINSLEIQRISLTKNFHYRNWHMENRIRFQHVSDDSVIHVPRLNLFHSVYWEKDLLNKAFILTAGMRFRYLSAFYGDSYMPASNFFYMQDSISCAGQPVFDFFTDMRIKGATIYLAFENVLQGIASNAYYMTPLYPQAGMTYRFGVRWFFLDQ